MGLARVETEDSPRQWRSWILIALLSVSAHFFLFRQQVNWGPGSRPPAVEVHQIDPKKLEAIRNQWKNQPKGLLIDKDKNKRGEKEVPPNARYMSDKNIRVEKEQRARNTNVIPKPGVSNFREQKAQTTTPKTQVEKLPQLRSVPDVGNLGVKFKLTPKSEAEKQEGQRNMRSQPANPPPGGEQAILDDALPEGSQNLLNTQESIYYSFYARLYEAIGPIWQSRINEVSHYRRVRPGDYSTYVDVVLDREGNLLEIRMLQSSGVREFDLAVDSSWRKIARFPNPPHGLLDAYEQVHTAWTFTVRVAQGFGLEYLPPERLE